ncbi:MAG: LytR C-terminal domain-containing protein [Actinomycetota bacterium]
MGGRHSSTQQGPFVWSVVAWLLPWVLIAAVAGVAVSIAVDALGRDALETPPPTAATESPSPSPSPTRSPTAAPTRTTKSPSKPAETQVDLITEGITVQVLNATGSSSADDVMADRLASLGFEVISVDSAAGSYERTTVFWSYPDAREAAEALARRFGWVVQEKPANLSATVALHVVVGADEA